MVSLLRLTGVAVCFLSLWCVVLGSSSEASVASSLASLASVDSQAFAIPASMHSRHQRSDVLEFRSEGESLTILASSAVPGRVAKMYSATSQTTVGELLASRAMNSVLRRSNLHASGPVPMCAIIAAGKPVARTEVMSSVLAASPSKVSLQCQVNGNENEPRRAEWHFRSFAELFPEVVADNKRLTDLVESVQKQVATANKEGNQASPDQPINAADRDNRDRIMLSLAAKASGAAEVATPQIAALYPTQAVDYGSNEKWVIEALEANKFFGQLPAYPTWKQHGSTGRFDAHTGAALAAGQKASASPADLHIGLVADWAAGTVESDYVGQLLSEFGTPDWTINAGDIYWTGTYDNVAQTSMGVPAKAGGRGVKWPHGKLGSWHVLGNHELYAQGKPFFEKLMPTLGTKTVRQAASYASLETAEWRILLLDTGFLSYQAWGNSAPPEKTDLTPEQYLWIEQDLHLSDPNDKRGLLVITHHQPNSPFDDVFVLPAQGLADRLPAGRTFVWLFGHEHKVWLTAPTTVTGHTGRKATYHGRCIGNSGFPTNIVPTGGPVNPKGSGDLLGYDDRLYTVLPSEVDPQTKNGDNGLKKAFNGWVNLKISGKTLSIEYRTLKLSGKYVTNQASDLFASETFTVDNTGNAVHSIAPKFNSAISPVKMLSVRPNVEGAGQRWIEKMMAGAKTAKGYIEHKVQAAVAAVKANVAAVKTVVKADVAKVQQVAAQVKTSIANGVNAVEQRFGMGK